MRAIVGFVRMRLSSMLCLLAPPSAAEPLAASGRTPAVVRTGLTFSAEDEQRFFR